MLLTMEKDANFLNFSIYYNSCHNIKIISSHVEDKSLVEFEQLTTKHANAVTYNSYDSCKQRLNSFFNKLNVKQYEMLFYIKNTF